MKTKIVLEAIKENKSLVEIASEFEIHPRSVSNIKKEFLSNANLVFNGSKSINLSNDSNIK